MSRTQSVLPQQKHARAQTIAREAADRYFAALAAEIPFDTAPGDVDLIAASNAIQDVLRNGDDRQGAEEASAMNAGYLLGIEVGRRIGGVR